MQRTLSLESQNLRPTKAPQAAPDAFPSSALLCRPLPSAKSLVSSTVITRRSLSQWVLARDEQHKPFHGVTGKRTERDYMTFIPGDDKTAARRVSSILSGGRI